MAGLLIGTMAGGGSINARCPRLSRVVSAASLGHRDEEIWPVATVWLA